MIGKSKVLLTGATGFIGSHLAGRLISEGFTVRALVRNPRNISRLSSLGVECLQGDLLDRARLDQVVKHCDVVYHLAVARPGRGPEAKAFRRVNVEGTENLARASMEADVSRFVFASSGGVYGVSGNSPALESQPAAPDSPYRRSKHDAEQLLLAFHRNKQLPVVIARLPSVMGPGSTSWLDLIRTVSRSRFRMIGRGNNRKHVGFVADIVSGLRLCADVPGIEGEIYNLSGAECSTVNRLIASIAEATHAQVATPSLPAGPFLALYRISLWAESALKIQVPYGRRYELFLFDKEFDLTKARDDLGYRPEISIESGIQELVGWYRENGYL